MSSAAREAGANLTFGEEYKRRTYAIATQARALELGAQKTYDELVIALSIEPTPQDALPHLERACRGAGAPAGILACDVLGGAMVVEARPASAVALGALLTVEMRRLGGFRKTRLLTPLSLETAAAIAASGTSCPDLAPDRVLEMLVADAGLV